MDLPTLQAIAARTWGKEDELKALKAELATLYQKITPELAPKQEKQNFGEEVKKDEASKQVKVTRIRLNPQVQRSRCWSNPIPLTLSILRITEFITDTIFEKIL